jgi:zinc ribbon protein
LNCPYCGQSLPDPIPPSCPNCGKILPKANDPPYVDQPQAEYQTRKGLGDLRNAFLLYLIGSAITLIPVIGAIGGIISLVALILLIIGWRALGRSSLKERQNYRSTGSWLVYAIIIVIVIAIVGTAVIVGFIVSYFIAHPIQPATSPPAIPSLSQFPGISQFVYGLVLEIGVLILVWYSVWFKMLNSMRKLGSELSQPRLRTAANLNILQILASIATGVAFVLVLFYGNYSSLFSHFASTPNLGFFGIFGYFGLGGYLPLLALIFVGEEVMVIVSYYLAYSALGSAIRNLAPIPPPQINTGQFCPHCGHAVDPSNSFCPNCGTKLRN